MRRLLPFLLLFLVVVAVYLSGGLELLENRFTDARFCLLQRPAESGLVLVTIDPPSLRRLGVWPWPRGYHATVLENLLDAGARRVGFDVDFSSRASDPQQDAELEGALATAVGRVVLPVFRQREREAESGSERLFLTGPLPRFAAHVTLGTINVRPDRDGLARTYWTRETVRGKAVPSFAAALEGRSDGPESFHVDYGVSPESIPRLSYVRALAGAFDPALVRGRDVIVGSTAIELGDQIAVPIRKAIPGPVLQALAYESIAAGRTLRRTGPLVNLLTALVAAMAVGPWIQRSSWRRGLVVAAGLSVVWFLVSVGLHRGAGLMLDVAPWAATLTGAYAFGLVRRIDQQTLGLLAQGRRIERTEILMRHVVENSFDAIVTVREDGTVETANPAAAAMFGIEASRMAGCLVRDFIPRQPDGGADFAQPDTAAPRELIGRRGDGSTFPLELALTTIRAGGETRRVAFLRDITERKAQREALEHQATHDALTGLPNRVLLGRRIRQALTRPGERHRPVAFLILDLDRFKEINDTLGHHLGDLLLRRIARRLLGAIRPGDTIARFGGDEFALLLPGTGETEAAEAAWHLVRVLQDPFRVEKLSLRVDTSVGIALFPEHGTDATTLIQRADVAMYVAKRTRAGVAVYDPRQDVNSVRQLSLTADLRSALETGGLSLVYQPKVSAADGSAAGVEVLVRWRHPEHGQVRPDEIVALAEHSGLMRDLTRWVLETALRQCADWRRRGLGLGVSVNVSARNLVEEDFPTALGRLLENHGVPGSALILEITESAIMEDPDKALEVLLAVAALGVGVSIDDFGTGYSSLAYLKKLPAREIKIDRSFVTEMDRNRDDATIVRSTVELAHNLGLEVVAEGVETAVVWESLRRLGCDYGQGYLFSPPAQPDELTRGLQRGVVLASST